MWVHHRRYAARMNLAGDRVYSDVAADKLWEQIGDGFGTVASPTGDQDGNVFFADAAAKRIFKVDLNGRVNVFKDHSRGAIALRVGPDGRLYPSQPDNKRIVSGRTAMRRWPLETLRPPTLG